jgi:hypothetical protein
MVKAKRMHYDSDDNTAEIDSIASLKARLLTVRTKHESEEEKLYKAYQKNASRSWYDGEKSIDSKSSPQSACVSL